MKMVKSNTKKLLVQLLYINNTVIEIKFGSDQSLLGIHFVSNPLDLTIVLFTGKDVLPMLQLGQRW